MKQKRRKQPYLVAALKIIVNQPLLLLIVRQMRTSAMTINEIGDTDISDILDITQI